MVFVSLTLSGMTEGVNRLSLDKFFVIEPRLKSIQDVKDPCKYDGLYHDPGCGAVVIKFLL